MNELFIKCKERVLEEPLGWGTIRSSGLDVFI